LRVLFFEDRFVFPEVEQRVEQTHSVFCGNERKNYYKSILGMFQEALNQLLAEKLGIVAESRSFA